MSTMLMLNRSSL